MIIFHFREVKDVFNRYQLYHLSRHVQQTSQNGQKQTKENNVIWLSRIHYKKKQIWIPLPVHQIIRCIFELCAPTKVIVGKYLSALHKLFCVSELDKVKCSQFLKKKIYLYFIQDTTALSMIWSTTRSSQTLTDHVKITLGTIAQLCIIQVRYINVSIIFY